MTGAADFGTRESGLNLGGGSASSVPGRIA